MGKGKKRKNQEANQKTKGPRLPNALRKEIEALNHTAQASDDEGIAAVDDIYEYEEGIPEEESRKNRRYDTVDNYEYELPEDFEVVKFVLYLIYWFLIG